MTGIAQKYMALLSSFGVADEVGKAWYLVVIFWALKRCIFSDDTCFNTRHPFEVGCGRLRDEPGASLERGYCCGLSAMLLLTADDSVKLRSSWSFISFR